MLRLEEVSLEDPQVRELLTYHQRHMNEISPPGTSFALNLSGLATPDITIYGAWEHERLSAVGALRRMTESHVELKSMRTHVEYLGRGAAQAILDYMLARAVEEGIQRISLETGTSDAFKPAIAFYLKNGFQPGDAFADYFNGPHNQCYHLELDA
ncbi:GNAT family N-acetyltransferase [Pseudohaliea sp.]|uniref:GNAT family N-acetyltransferase n=1 Tax=Pseudohaliea sp. TaxID=2740289 RepID=UPI0032F05674